MLKNGLTLFLAVSVLCTITVLTAYSQLQGMDAEVTSLTLSSSAYVQAFGHALQEQFVTPLGAFSILFLLLIPVLVTFINKTSKLINLLVWLPMVGIIIYATGFRQAQATREISGIILNTKLLWFGYGTIIFLLGVLLLYFQKNRKKKTLITPDNNSGISEKESKEKTMIEE